jgi:hypothetical protein
MNLSIIIFIKILTFLQIGNKQINNITDKMLVILWYICEMLFQFFNKLLNEFGPLKSKFIIKSHQHIIILLKINKNKNNNCNFEP